MASKISQQALKNAISSGQVLSEEKRCLLAYNSGRKFSDLQISELCKIDRHEVPDRRKRVNNFLKTKGYCIKLVDRKKCDVTKVIVGFYKKVKIS